MAVAAWAAFTLPIPVCMRRIFLPLYLHWYTVFPAITNVFLQLIEDRTVSDSGGTDVMRAINFTGFIIKQYIIYY
jgi:hypothetical protein